MVPDVAEDLLVAAPFSPWAAASFFEPPAEVAVSGGVILVSVDGSSSVEGTFVPILASSPDAVDRGALLAGLKKRKEETKNNSMKPQK